MSNVDKLPLCDFAGKVAIITGASRGIGRDLALALARLKCNIVVVAKTTEAQPTLPGTIYTVADEVRALGVQALPLAVDLRDEVKVLDCVAQTIAKFGRVDFLINNASALWWQDMKDTPIKKYDLITGINSRGTFAITQACLPHMVKQRFGRVVTMSPPIQTDPSAFAGMTAYNISKFGMTMCALGVAAEYKDYNITGNSLWPATVVESLASENFKLGDKSIWRKAAIISDATIGIISEGGEFTGNMLIDDEYLRTKGLSDEDFVKYRYDPNVEPPRLLAGTSVSNSEFKRGNVKTLGQDMQRSKL